MRGQKNLYSSETINRMVEMAKAGFSCPEIGRALSVPRTTVRTLLIPRGVSFNKPLEVRQWTEHELSRAVKMRAEGLTFKEVGSALGRSADAVRNKMNETGLHESEQPKTHLVDIKPSPEMFAARDRKYEAEARRDLSAILMGDPPAGFSALDAKRQKKWQAQVPPWGRHV